MWVGGYNFETPPPLVTKDGIEPFPPTGVRALHSRVAWFYGYTGVTPAMCMRLTGVGSQYVFAFRDADGNRLDGCRPTFRPPASGRSPRQTRSELQTGQHLPRLGSQSGTVETNPDGSTDLYFGPVAPEGKENNWLQTVPGKGWWIILRLYNPLQPFFDKTWRPSEIEPHGAEAN